MTRRYRHSARLFLAAGTLAIGLTAFGEADAQSGTKLYRSVPTTAELSQDLFGDKSSMRTRGLKTRGIRWHQEELEPQPAQASTDLSYQTASLEPTPEPSEKLAFNIQFYFDSVEIKPESKPFIDRLGEVLNVPENRGSALMIVGHTDSSGSDIYNLGLSKRRAEAMRDYLVGVWGIDPATLVIDGRGEYEPLADLNPRDSANRRVEFWALAG